VADDLPEVAKFLISPAAARPIVKTEIVDSNVDRLSIARAPSAE